MAANASGSMSSMVMVVVASSVSCVSPMARAAGPWSSASNTGERAASTQRCARNRSPRTTNVTSAPVPSSSMRRRPRRSSSSSGRGPRRSTSSASAARSTAHSTTRRSPRSN
ncbi:Os08g0340601, partial [Oryza sativa Japonica Group]